MNRRQLSFLLAGAVVVGTLPSCHCTRGTRSAYVGPPWKGDTCDRCTAPGPQPPRFTQNPPPFVPAPAPPPGAVPSPPGSGVQQNAFFPPRPPGSPMPPGGTSGGLLGAPEPAGPEPARPMPSGPVTPRDTVRLSPPQTAEPPPAALSVPGAKERRDASPAMPVDIPHFAIVKTDVASGQQPFPEGVAWLKSHGYRTVLYIRAPGEEDRVPHDVFEQQGMKYRSLELSAETLSKTNVVDEFNRLVTDTKNLPLFVYDKDSTLAGALWYLHFRIADKMSDEKARAEAGQLGFKEGSDNPQLKNMWIAVQNYLAKNKP